MTFQIKSIDSTWFITLMTSQVDELGGPVIPGTGLLHRCIIKRRRTLRRTLKRTFKRTLKRTLIKLAHFYIIILGRLVLCVDQYIWSI